MFCPKCFAEYPTGTKECSSCGVALVDSLQDEDTGERRPEFEYVDLVAVLATPDPPAVSVARSILEEAGIRYFVRGELVGFNRGAMEIMVAREDEEEARALLKDLA